MAPTGVPHEIEAKVLAERLGEGVDLSLAASLAEGTRRALRVPVRELKASVAAENSKISDTREQMCDCVVEFVLPKGSFATTVVGCVIDDSTSAEPESPDGASET